MKTTPRIIVFLTGFIVATSSFVAPVWPQGHGEARRAPAPRSSHSSPKSVRRLPAKYTRVVHGGVEYYLWGGVFHRRTPSGYIVVPGPVGVRIGALPEMAVTVLVGSTRLYYYYGTYYRYDPAAKVYVVVTPEKEPIRDIVVLSDGQSFTGEYLGGNEQSIDLRVGDEVLEIRLKDIVSITFSSREYMQSEE